MAMQERKILPHRLAKSAKDLAQASLSGVACELKDPRMAKQTAGSSSRQVISSRQDDDGFQSGELPRSRPALYARENSFRNQPHAAASRAVEKDFDRFQSRDLRQEDLLSSDLTAWVKVTPESVNYQVDSYRVQNESHASPFPTPESTAMENAKNAINSNNQRPDTEFLSDSKQDSKADQARAAAARRLEQIGAQIQRNLAIQALQQDDASVQAHLTSTAAMNLQYESAQQITHQQPPTSQSSYTDSMSNSHQASWRQRQQQTASLDRNHAQLSEEAREDDDANSQVSFHCPYYACHQNLQRLASSSRRACVHTGCNEQLGTQKAWNEHIALPHHDLQG